MNSKTITRMAIVAFAILLTMATGCLDPVRLINDTAFGPPDSPGYTCGAQTPVDFDLEATTLSIQISEQITLDGWMVHAQSEPAAGTVVMFNGGGITASCTLRAMTWLPEGGYNIVVWNYPGMGGSTGDKDIASVLHASRQVVNWAYDNDGNNNDVVLMGTSFGSGPAVKLAGETEQPVAGVILDSTFDLPSATFSGVRGLLLAMFRGMLLEAYPAELIASQNVVDVSTPLLMLHGQHDELTSLAAAREIYEQCPEAYEFLAFDSGHVDLLADDPQRYQEAILSFLDFAIDTQ